MTSLKEVIFQKLGRRRVGWDGVGGDHRKYFIAIGFGSCLTKLLTKDKNNLGNKFIVKDFIKRNQKLKAKIIKSI